MDQTASPAERRRGHLAMLLFSALVAGSFALGGLAAPAIDPSALNLVRFVIATAAVGLVARAQGHRLGWPEHRAAWRFLLLGALGATYFVTMFHALQITDPVATSAVFTLTPLMAAACGWILMRQRTSIAMLVAMTLAATGALWIIFRADLGALRAFAIGPGERIFAIGCLAYALQTALVRPLNRGEPVILFSFYTLVAQTVVIGIWGWRPILATDWLALPAIVWVTILYTALAASAATFFLIQYSALRLPAGQVMAYTYLTPSFVLVWSGLLGQGWSDPVIWVGTALAAAGLGLLLVTGARVRGAAAAR
ncbi:DMT family transporter [Oceanomicrobium pacificus]|uniref:EamA family transporter n=1 Tax=Oceanomicrobium pacificus TaxID=2692916 RepID=A0A6B0TWG0_9RHOB|nr:DMT family transporter [Oceanomicrobium pacificus]MXU65592.1 EamA family transporter [Oceanomicrobium pacificus]